MNARQQRVLEELRRMSEERRPPTVTELARRLQARKRAQAARRRR